MKCCKAAHVILDFGVNGLATYTTRAVLGRIFPVFYGRVGKMGGLRISSIRGAMVLMVNNQGTISLRTLDAATAVPHIITIMVTFFHEKLSFFSGFPISKRFLKPWDALYKHPSQVVPLLTHCIIMIGAPKATMLRPKKKSSSPAIAV